MVLLEFKKQGRPCFWDLFNHLFGFFSTLCVCKPLTDDFFLSNVCRSFSQKKEKKCVQVIRYSAVTCGYNIIYC